MRLSKEKLKSPPWYLKPFFWNQKRKYGQVLEPARIWATNPSMFIAVASLYGILERKHSPLAPELRSLITVRVSQLNECNFCMDLNSATLNKRSGSDEKSHALPHWQTSDLFSPREKAVLDYAEKMTLSNKHPDDQCFNELKHYFNDQEIVELTALIAFQNMSSKFNSALELEAQGFVNKKMI